MGVDMDLVQHGDTVVLPGRGPTAVLALSQQLWVVGTADGLLLRLELDSRGTSAADSGSLAAPTSTHVRATCRVAGRINELTHVALDDAGVILVSAANEPHLVVTSPSLQTVYRTVTDRPLSPSGEAEKGSLDAEVHPGSPFPWISEIQRRSRGFLAMAMFYDAMSKMQRLIILSKPGKLHLFETDDPESPVELTFRSDYEVEVAHDEEHAGDQAPQPIRMMFGGADGRVLCIRDSTFASFVRIGKDTGTRPMAFAARIELASLPASDGSVAQDPPKSHSRHNSFVASPENPAEAVIRFLQGMQDGFMFKGDRFCERVCAPLPKDMWLIDVGGSIATYSSFGAKVDDTTTPQPGRRPALPVEVEEPLSWSEAMPGDAVLQVAAAPPLLLSRRSPKADEIEVRCMYLQGRQMDPLQTLPRVKVTRFPDCRMVTLNDKNDRGPLFAFLVSERGAMITSLCLRRPIDLVLRELENEDELDLALSLTPEHDHVRLISVRLKLAERELRQDRHRQGLNLITQSVDPQKRIQVGLDLRQKYCSPSWLRKNNAVAWADFLYNNRPRVSDRLLSDSTATLQVDRAILEALCLADTTADRVSNFLRSGTALSSEDCEAIISGKSSNLPLREQNLALLKLYDFKQDHDRVLQILETSPDGGIKTVLEYVDRVLSSDHEGDITKALYLHLPYIVEEAGEDAGFRILTHGTLPFDDSVDFIRRRRDQLLLLRFLEHVHRNPFSAVGVNEADLSLLILQELCVVIRQRLDARKGSLKEMSSDDELKRIRAKLDEYLEYDLCDLDRQLPYDPTLVLKEIPESLFSERAFLLSVTGKLQDAINLLVFEAHDLDGAEQLCSSLGKDDLAQTLNGVLESCLPTGVSPDGRDGSAGDSISLVAAFLTRFKDFDILASSAFLNVPDDVPVATLKPLLLSILSSSNERLKEAKIQGALVKAETLRLQESLIAQKKRYAVVDSETRCANCKRLIGEAVCGLYHDGRIAHFSCYRRGHPPGKAERTVNFG